MSTQTLTVASLETLDNAKDMLHYCTHSPETGDTEKHHDWYQTTVKHIYAAKIALDEWKELDATHRAGYLRENDEREMGLVCLELLSELR